MSGSDAMDTKKVEQALQDALAHQGTSILTMSLLAGALRGATSVAIKLNLRSFVLAELEDTYLLVEKLSALGGIPQMGGSALDLPSGSGAALRALMDHERAGVAALHAVIADSGQEPRSEALEHLLEHVIMRKQQQIDFLWHALDEDAEPYT